MLDRSLQISVGQRRGCRLWSNATWMYERDEEDESGKEDESEENEGGEEDE